MASNTRISWTDATWNPITGCTRISPGCLHCYIERQPPLRMARRRFNGPGIGATTGVQLHPERLGVPLHWRRPRRIFVCSLADVFHRDVPDEHIAQIWATMSIATQHTFQIVTKRPARMRSLLRSDKFWYTVDRARMLQGHAPFQTRRHWLLNTWLSVTVEDQDAANRRIPILLETPAAVRGVSAEPLLGPIDLEAADWHALHDGGLDWVVAGGETGPGARLMDPAWARSLRDQCQQAGRPIAFHFKQWGGRRGHDRELDGRVWDEYPQRLVEAAA